MARRPDKTDAQLQEDVRHELACDTRVEATDIGVEVHSAVVTLTGTVDSWTARVAAQEAAHRVAGVLDVANDVEVKLPGSSEKSDTDIARKVREQLEWDLLVPDQRIRTTVSNGVVTLEGVVDSSREHDDAARAVRGVAGVRDVQNLLIVEPPVLTVRTLEKAIDDALERHITRAERHVKIEIEGDTVKLSGEVPSWAERAAVEGAVQDTPGVRRLESTLRIHP